MPISKKRHDFGEDLCLRGRIPKKRCPATHFRGVRKVGKGKHVGKCRTHCYVRGPFDKRRRLKNKLGDTKRVNGKTYVWKKYTGRDGTAKRAWRVKK